MGQIPKHQIIILLGDFNLRWHGRFQTENDVLGPFTFGMGTAYLASHSHNNRDLGLEFFRAHRLVFLNSHFR